MDALNYHQQKRSDAITWWNALSVKQKYNFAKKHFPDLNPLLLSGPKIEHIFKKETKG